MALERARCGGWFDLHIAYIKTPFAQITGGLLVLSVLGMALIAWLVSREG